ncbi:MAG: hypothetical protein A2V66_04120 [Ignavibacteria bacterium RBG_13_36_8]|nr:MAG: hypothetical protein A2V66_04120 [Ignavibacteria bacterium RBG_13_36_8]
MNHKIKILFVCTVNKLRSRTAEELYKNDPRFDVKSAGVDPLAVIRISRELLEWADFILVMEKVHRNIIHKKFPDIYKNKRIICLYIPDIFEFMNPELIQILRTKVEDIYISDMKL